MIDIKEAVSRARSDFDNVFEGCHVREVLLEEAELAEDGKYWLLIYSFDWQPSSGTASIGPGDRRYKKVKIDAETGMMLSIKDAKL